MSSEISNCVDVGNALLFEDSDLGFKAVQFGLFEFRLPGSSGIVDFADQGFVFGAVGVSARFSPFDVQFMDSKIMVVAVFSRSSIKIDPGRQVKLTP